MSRVDDVDGIDLYHRAKEAALGENCTRCDKPFMPGSTEKIVFDTRNRTAYHYGCPRPGGHAT